MKRLFTLILWTLLIIIPVCAQDIAHYEHSGPALLPDPRVTPGDAVTRDAQAVCVPGYARRERNVSPELKREVYALYGVHPSIVTRNGKQVRKCCEVDHLISLELGGSNDIKNLWPQPYIPQPGARQKDTVEDWLHERVCSGKMSLSNAQHAIATDWYGVYLSMRKRD